MRDARYDVLFEPVELGPVLDRRAEDSANISDNLSPESRGWLIKFRAASRHEREQAMERDPAEEDWNDPLLAMRPRWPKKRGDVS